MHIPSIHKVTDTDILYQFIKDYPLATLVSVENSVLNANHIPLYLQTSTEKATLQGHINKANTMWQECVEDQKVLLIFHGPNAYISPNYYESKQHTSKQVPTWNYSVVHVQGRIYFKHDRQWTLQSIENLTDYHESSQAHPYSIADAPKEYIDTLLKAVVGMEVMIDTLVGNFKLSQNKTHDDWAGVISALRASGKESDCLVAQQMQKHSFH